MHWRRVGGAAICLSLVLLGGWELGWRQRGFAPSMEDNSTLWIRAREQIARDGAAAIALVGASRMQVDVDLATFATEAGTKPAQLAINGHSGISVLRHLAHDPRFSGLVICDLVEDDLRELQPGVASGGALPEQWIREFTHAQLFRRFEGHVRLWVQSHFVLRLPELSLRNLVSSIRAGKLPAPSYAFVDGERRMHTDYQRLDIGEHRRHREKSAAEYYAAHPPLTGEEWRTGVAALSELIKRIHARDGRVMLVRMPVSGRIWEMDQARYPKRDYWDFLAAQTGVRAVHFADVPQLTRFVCPDGSHLDVRDASPFTRELVWALGLKR